MNFRTIIMANLLILSSCTVFENRDKCPSYVIADIQYDSDKNDDGSLTMLRYRDGAFDGRDMYGFAVEQHTYEIPVETGMWDFLFFSRLEEGMIDGPACRINMYDSSNWPKLFVSSKHILVDKNVFSYKSILRKEYWQLDLVVRGEGHNVSRIELLCNSSSLDARNLEPCGDEKKIRFEGNSIKGLILPRQKDGRVELAIYDESSDPQPRVVHLGTLMKREGYDWSALDLADVAIEIDLEKEVTVIQIITY